MTQSPQPVKPASVATAAAAAPRLRTAVAAPGPPAPGTRRRQLAARAAALRLALSKRVSLANYLRFLVLFAVIATSSIAAIYSLNSQYRKSLQDTWAIIFLNNERACDTIADRLRKLAFQVDGGSSGNEAKWRKPDFLHRIVGSKTTSPVDGAALRRPLLAAELGPKGLARNQSRKVAVLDGVAYQVVTERGDRLRRLLDVDYPAGDYLVGWRVELPRWLEKQGGPRPDDTTNYIATTDGRLVYSNDGTIGQAGFAGRPLVQQFIAGSLGLAQFELAGSDGKAIFGFYRQVPDSNLVFFSEISKAKALAGTFAIARKFALVLLVVVTLCVVGLQLPLRGVILPLRELVALSDQVSRGNFDVKPRTRGFGELLQLTSSFATMAQNLTARDKAIQSLIVHQQEKFRMERELAVAHSVQDNLLPNEPLDRRSGLEIAAIYAPATKVAGDWFGYHHAADSGLSLIVMADISGHDMAASLFTAIIAGCFEEIIENEGLTLPLKLLADKLNRRLIQFGRFKWHATLQITRFDKAVRKFEVLNCGHPFPIVFYKGGKLSKVLRLPSQPIGMSADCPYATATVDFAVGDTLLMYTDGLSETRNPHGTVYGLKRIVERGRKQAALPPSAMLRDMRNDAERFRKSPEAADDLCMLAVRGLP